MKDEVVKFSIPFNPDFAPPEVKIEYSEEEKIYRMFISDFTSTEPIITVSRFSDYESLQ